MTKGSLKLRIAYDATGPIMFKYNDATYQYVTNPQGDVIALLDTSGNKVVEYTYAAL